MTFSVGSDHHRTVKHSPGQIHVLNDKGTSVGPNRQHMFIPLKNKTVVLQPEDQFEMCTSKNSPVILKFLLQLERVETRRLPCPCFSGAGLALQNTFRTVFSASGVLLRPCLSWLRYPSSLTSLPVKKTVVLLQDMPETISGSYNPCGPQQLSFYFSSLIFKIIIFQLPHGHSTYLSGHLSEGGDSGGWSAKE